MNPENAKEAEYDVRDEMNAIEADAREMAEDDNLIGDEPEDDGPTYSGMSASYSAEDNKLRLYSVSRLSKETYAQVKAAGFRWAPKQELFVAPSWSPSREDLLLELAGEIDDEDYSPEERAADRAERFSGYRDKRRSEAGGLADRFDAGPSAFGHQNRARAERQARRHDRYRSGAVSQWSKAEYWQRRTEGVISNALYKSSAPVRRSRILTLESELRKVVAGYTPTDNPPHIIQDEGVAKVWVGPKGRGGYWVRLDSIEERKESAARWVAHYENRLAYERSMLAAEGGAASDADMEPGGFIGSRQIHAVNRSNVTGKVVSVKILNDKGRLGVYNIERMPEGAYRSPTDEEREAFKVATAERKAKEKATRKVISLINPTDEDAQKLQDLWNDQVFDGGMTFKTAGRASEVLRMTQKQYSAMSGGSSPNVETAEITERGLIRRRSAMGNEVNGRTVTFKVRVGWPGGFSSKPRRVVILTDKPQKPIPWAAMEAAQAGQPTMAKMLPRLDELAAALGLAWLPSWGKDAESEASKKAMALINDAVYLGLAYIASVSQFGWTDKGYKVFRENLETAATPAAVEANNLDETIA